GASFTQRTIPSIPIGSSISPEGFLLLVLLLVVIIVMVVIVIVILIVVDDAVRVGLIRDELDKVVEKKMGNGFCFLGGNNSSGTKEISGIIYSSKWWFIKGDGVNLADEITGGVHIIADRQFSRRVKKDSAVR
ncbi:hypothetical protein Tco_0962129, partial [Tanacetum coccineum]